MAAPRIRTEVQVMFFDTDCGGVVSKSHICVRRDSSHTPREELGLALAEMAETQRYPVVVHTEIDYRRAANLGIASSLKAGSIDWSASDFGVRFASFARR